MRGKDRNDGGKRCPLGRSNLVCPKKSFKVKFFHQSFFGRAHVMNDTERAFLPYKLILLPYTSNYHFSSYLAYLLSKALSSYLAYLSSIALKYSCSFSVQDSSVPQNIKMGASNVINEARQAFLPFNIAVVSMRKRFVTQIMKMDEKSAGSHGYILKIMTDQPTDRPSNQPTNIRISRFIGKLHFQ